jgi:uncharacterized protein with FMN-binding domain
MVFPHDQGPDPSKKTHDAAVCRATEPSPALLDAVRRATEPSSALLDAVRRATEPSPALLDAVRRATEPSPALLDAVRRATEPSPALLDAVRRATEPSPALYDAVTKVMKPSAGLRVALSRLSEPAFAAKLTLNFDSVVEAARSVAVETGDAGSAYSEPFESIEKQLPKPNKRTIAASLAALPVLTQVALLAAALELLDRTGLFMADLADAEVPAPLKSGAEVLFCVVAFVLLWIQPNPPADP